LMPQSSTTATLSRRVPAVPYEGDCAIGDSIG
jgi:hypothetical protein